MCMNQTYCNNCGKSGHSFSHCKTPITSYGIIAFRITPEKQVEYLMVRRKDTLGYVDFMRGKYSVHNKSYIMNMLKQMTRKEKEKLLLLPFSELWKDLWGDNENEYIEQYHTEETISGDKFETLTNGILIHGEVVTLKQMIDESINTSETWEEAEWGFPKGRRNYQERDYTCAVREFCEETGYLEEDLMPLHNVFPYEETFMGSNYKSYRHKYYLTYMKYNVSLKMKPYQTTEISGMEWKTFDQCMKNIRYYNLEKSKMLTRIHETLTGSLLFFE